MPCAEDKKNEMVCKFITTNADYFHGCIVYVKDYNLAKIILDRLLKIFENKVKVISSSLGDLKGELEKIKLGTTKVLIMLNSVVTQYMKEGQIPSNVDLVINAHIPD